MISGDRRAALGECFHQSLKLKGVTDEAQLTKALNAPLRAPLVLAGLLHAVDHEKIPRDEQGHAVAASLHAAQLAADALGFGCVWRTGGYATDPHVVEALGGNPGDQVIGFLYIGTRDARVSCSLRSRLNPSSATFKLRPRSGGALAPC